MSVELKVGQVWKDREGRNVEIVSRDDDASFPFDGSNAESYTPSGTIWAGGTEQDEDLIELVQDENGWMPWVATEEDSLCPVSPQTIVRVRGKSGSESECRAGNIYWCARSNDKLFDTIVAYKIVKEAQKAPDPVHAEAHSAPQRTPRRHLHYFKDVSQINEIDVYRVCELFGVDDPSGATQHAVKKILCAGQRGAKDRAKDYQEAIDTLTRRVEMWAESQQ